MQGENSARTARCDFQGTASLSQPNHFCQELRGESCCCRQEYISIELSNCQVDQCPVKQGFSYIFQGCLFQASLDERRAFRRLPLYAPPPGFLFWGLRGFWQAAAHAWFFQKENPEAFAIRANPKTK